MIRLTRRRAKELTVTAQAEPLADLRVGKQDLAATGWHNDATGELFPGFGAGPDDMILDVGCGDVPVSAFLAGSGASFVLADILPEAVQRAAESLRGAGARSVTGITTDCSPIPLADASVTRVVASEIIEHVEEPSAFLAELSRVGTADALYLISAPHETSEELQRPFAAPDYFEPPNHIRVLSSDAMASLIREAGFDIISHTSEGFYSSMWWCFFWASSQPQVGPPFTDLLNSCQNPWHLLLDTPQGPELKRQLDALIPKRQVVIARKAGQAPS